MLKNKAKVPGRQQMTLKAITGKYAIAATASGFRICQQGVLSFWYHDSLPQKIYNQPKNPQN